MPKTLSVCLCLGWLSLAGGWALAQTPVNSTGQPKKSQQSRTQAAAHSKAHAKKVAPKAGPAAVAAATPAAMPVPLGPEALRVAEQVHTGTLPCELGRTVSLAPDHRAPGYFRVQGQGFRYHMRPVASRTGVIRLEDEKAGAVWLQLADKSMLMDQKKGRRLADACAHPQQLAAAAQMQHNPPGALFEIDKAASQD